MKAFATPYRTAESKDRQPAIVSIVIGGASKIVASIATYPYQVVKTRLQQRDLPIARIDVKNSIEPSVASDKPTKTVPRYNGAIDCALKIWR